MAKILNIVEIEILGILYGKILTFGLGYTKGQRAEGRNVLIVCIVYVHCFIERWVKFKFTVWVFKCSDVIFCRKRKFFNWNLFVRVIISVYSNFKGLNATIPWSALEQVEIFLWLKYVYDYCFNESLKLNELLFIFQNPKIG